MSSRHAKLTAEQALRKLLEDHSDPEDDFSTDDEEYQPESSCTAQTLLSGDVVADSDDSDSDSLLGAPPSC